MAFSLGFSGGSFAAASCGIQFTNMSVDVPNGTMGDAWNLLKKKYFPDLPLSQPHCKAGDRPGRSTSYADINLGELISEEKLPNGIGRNYALWVENHADQCFDDGGVRHYDYSGYYGNEVGYVGPYGATLNCGESQPENLTLQLTGLTETRPAGTGGTSTIALLAKVMNGTQPKSGIAVSFTVDVTPNSGGHEHHDVSRPKGSLSLSQGISDANGEIKLVFTAPQIAGIHTVKASCDGCTNSPASKTVQVKVPDLLNIFAMPYRDAQWAYPGIGETSQHSDQHYLTIAAATRMLEISQKFKKIWPNAPRLTLNDASLVWGGKLDIPGTWERNPRAHAEHRMGENIDVRANSAPGAVPVNIREIVFRWLRKTSRAEDNIPSDFQIESVNPLWENPGVANEHFHLRLGN